MTPEQNREGQSAHTPKPCSFAIHRGSHERALHRILSGLVRGIKDLDYLHPTVHNASHIAKDTMLRQGRGGTPLGDTGVLRHGHSLHGGVAGGGLGGDQGVESVSEKERMMWEVGGSRGKRGGGGGETGGGRGETGESGEGRGRAGEGMQWRCARTKIQKIAARNGSARLQGTYMKKFSRISMADIWCTGQGF